MYSFVVLTCFPGMKFSNDRLITSLDTFLAWDKKKHVFATEFWEKHAFIFNF